MQITSCQLNALFKLKSFLGFNEKNILIESFLCSHFNPFLLVWHFSNTKSLQKIKIIQNRAIQFFHNDYEASYKDLLDKENNHTIAIFQKRISILQQYNNEWGLEVNLSKIKIMIFNKQGATITKFKFYVVVYTSAILI